MAGRDIQVTIGTVSGLPLSGTVADGATVTDAASWVLDAWLGALDSAGITDALASVLTAYRVPADALGITDSVSAVLNGGGSVFGGNFGGNF